MIFLKLRLKMPCLYEVFAQQQLFLPHRVIVDCVVIVEELMKSAILRGCQYGLVGCEHYAIAPEHSLYALQHFDFSLVMNSTRIGDDTGIAPRHIEATDSNRFVLDTLGRHGRSSVSSNR